MRKKVRLVWIIVLWALALGWIAMLFFFSGQTAEESGRLSLWVTKLLLRLFPWIPLDVAALHPIIRKLAHGGVFALEGFLLGLASLETFRGLFSDVFSVVCCAAMAVLNEYSQTMAQGRSCEVRDMLIDFGGAVFGIIFAALVYAICSRIARRRKKLTFRA